MKHDWARGIRGVLAAGCSVITMSCSDSESDRLDVAAIGQRWSKDGCSEAPADYSTSGYFSTPHISPATYGEYPLLCSNTYVVDVNEPEEGRRTYIRTLFPEPATTPGQCQSRWIGVFKYRGDPVPIGTGGAMPENDWTPVSTAMSYGYWLGRTCLDPSVPDIYGPDSPAIRYAITAGYGGSNTVPVRLYYQW